MNTLLLLFVLFAYQVGYFVDRFLSALFVLNALSGE